MKTPKRQLINHLLKQNSDDTAFETVIEELEEYRQDRRYQFLAQFLKDHQVPQNARSVTKQILNDYGRRSVDLFVSLGKPKASLSPDFIMDSELADD